MKHRARRVTIAAAVLGAGVVGVLVILNWDTVRDHVEAWRFQLTRETRTIEPDSDHSVYPVDEHLLHVSARVSGYPVVFAPEEKRQPIKGTRRSPGSIKGLLEAEGWRILEQRLPRRAYIVIRDKEPSTGQEPDRLGGGGR